MKGIRSTLKIMGLYFLIIGLFGFGAAIYEAESNSKWRAQSVSTEGVYLMVGEGDVTIGYEAGGKEWVVRSSFYSSDMDVGDPVTVWYKPEDPGSGRITTWITWGLSLILGGVFSSVGAGFLIAVDLRDRKRKKLEENGMRVTAQVVSIQQVYAVRINRRHPYVIHAVCKHPYTGRSMEVRSEYLMKDPTQRIREGKVTVLVDPMHDHRYYMETDELL